MKRFLLALVMLTSKAEAQGQARGDVISVSGAAVDSAFHDLAMKPADVARELPTEAQNRYQLVVLRKRIVTPAEIHERWTDIVFVRSGSAILETGRGLIARKESGPSEWTGSAVRSPTARSISAGDIILIAAGVAHQWRPSGSEAFAYIVVKVRPGSTAP
jgi:mannose-6-phosphate isomerase-like protein (cupin superfamily)